MTYAFRLGAWLVEPDLNRISGSAGESIIEPKAMAVLECLAKRQGEVVSTDEFVAQVWGGRAMGDNPVYKTIAKLRKALGEGDAKYIETISKKGYRLVCQVTPANDGAGTKSRIPPKRPNWRLARIP